jgi:DNA-binding response OmpR family regulator
LEADDGNHALIQAIQNAPDLFLIDNDLPDGPGVDLAAELRLDHRFDRSTVIILSHEYEPARPADHVRPYDRWLKKPFDVTRLLEDILHTMAARTRRSV